MRLTLAMQKSKEEMAAEKKAAKVSALNDLVDLNFGGPVPQVDPGPWPGPPPLPGPKPSSAHRGKQGPLESGAGGGRWLKSFS